MLEILKKLEISSYIEHKHVIVDTNYIVESLNHPHIYLPILNYFLDAKAVLITIPLVTAEFLKGTHDKVSIKSKTDFINSMIPAVLAIDTTMTTLVVEKVILSYGNQSSKAAVTDLFLAAALMRYGRSSALLLTANYKDFPTSVFDRLISFPVDDGNEINTFSLYANKTLATT